MNSHETNNSMQKRWHQRHEKPRYFCSLHHLRSPFLLIMNFCDAKNSLQEDVCVNGVTTNVLLYITSPWVTKSDALKCSFYVEQGVMVTTSGTKLPQTHSNNFVKTINSLLTMDKLLKRETCILLSQLTRFAPCGIILSSSEIFCCLLFRVRNAFDVSLQI
jgi:hypothetical protein